MVLSQVWTEREGDIPGTAINEGDWEACVATAYSMALLYGGVKMAAPYTQAQRELLEYYGAAADRSQDLNLTDIKSMQVYGVKLRGATPGLTAAAALGRPGIGMCLTTNGSPGGFGTGFIHEVFWVGVSATAGLLYDPLAPAGSQPQSRTIAYIVPFIRGLADHQVREVKQWEFGPPPGEINMVIRPVREDFTTKTGNSTPGGQFYTEGPGAGSPKYFFQATAVTSVAESTDGSYRLIFYYNGGATGGEYLWMPRVNLNPHAGTRDPAVGYAKELATDADCTAEVAAATAALQAQLTAEQIKTQAAETKAKEATDLIKAHNEVESKMGAVT